NEVLVVGERFGLASGGRQRPYDQPMRVLPHVVECYGTLADLQSMFGAACGQLLFAESDQSTKRKFEQPLALAGDPFVPPRFADGDVIDQPAPVEIGCRAQRLPAALANQGFEAANIARNARCIE